jgi:TFIIF-interacting CTD phosphatase-like protein
MLILGRQIKSNVSIASGFIIKMRPFFKEFIETITKLFEVYVYTKGTRLYAESICNAIRNQYASVYYPTNNINRNQKYYDFLKDKNAFKINRIITRD